MQNRILVLSSNVPPAPTGSAVVIGNLARQFGRDEMIIAGGKAYPPLPPAWKDEWPEIVHVQSAWPFPGRGNGPWSLLQVPYVVWRSLRLVRRHKVDVILVVFPDEFFLLAGYLCARLSKRRLFGYFHNTYLENRRGWYRYLLARWLQPRFFASAEHIFVMSDGMRDLYSARYPTLQQTTLVHSFNEPLPSGNIPEAVGSPLSFVMCGNVNNTNHDATKRMVDVVASSADMHLMMYGGATAGYLDSLGLLRNNVSHAMVSRREELLVRLGRADIVFLPHGLSGAIIPEERQTIFPTKTIECLISGRPILAHVPPDCFLTRFLRQNDCALIVDQPDVDALRQAIRRLRTDYALRRRLVENALKAARRFQVKEVAAELKRWLVPPQTAKRRMGLTYVRTPIRGASQCLF